MSDEAESIQDRLARARSSPGFHYNPIPTIMLLVEANRLLVARVEELERRVGEIDREGTMMHRRIGGSDR